MTASVETKDVFALVSEDDVDELCHQLKVNHLEDAEIIVHPPSPGRYRLHDETLWEEGHAARNAALVGVVVGFALGLSIASIMDQIDTWTMAFLVGAAMAGFGGLIGAMVGLQTAESNNDDPVEYRDVVGDEHLMVVEVRSQHWGDRAHSIMHRWHATFLDRPTPI